MNERLGDTQIRTRPRLRAVAGGRRDDHVVRECAISRAAVRAGDRHEPWTLPASPALRALAAAAAEHGVDVELAVRVAVEQALSQADLSGLGVDLARVDAVAAAARVDETLDAASAAYLRRLTQGCGRRRDVPQPDAVGAERRDAAGGRTADLGELVTVGLPQRLSARLLRADVEALLAAADLERALAWEVAALAAGRTMSEWAPLAALRASA